MANDEKEKTVLTNTERIEVKKSNDVFRFTVPMAWIRALPCFKCEPYLFDVHVEKTPEGKIVLVAEKVS